MSNPFTQYDSEENRKQYEAEQKQRAMERRIRKSKREVMGYREAMENAQTDETKAAFEAKYQKKQPCYSSRTRLTTSIARTRG